MIKNILLIVLLIKLGLTALIPTTTVQLTEHLNVAGTYEDIDKDDENVRRALHHAVQLLNTNWTDNLYYWKVDKIFKARRQIVAGTFYDIQFELYKSDCVKNNQKLNECLNSAVKPVNDVSSTRCGVVVFNYLPTDGHGINDYKITNTTCSVSEDC